MSGRIPTSSSVIESAVIEAPFSNVWHLLKLQDFAKFYNALDKSEWVKGASPDTDIVKWSFKDGTVLEVKQEEHSTIDHYITYSVISSQPAISYSSVVSTVRAYPITSGSQAGHTFVTWSGNFSSDADAGVIEDAKFKRREALADLAKAVSKK
ncbi:uncharacterized protein J7T54_005286 [Emericellopsis cladophorae]|uniref:Bet v1-like protein n=1 Tax=Emericellopsis cladophorae TaxID=2686198 RepID=A0A9P9Y1X3_9HYPO|nr:uncharacterized protein J7T54_005286 [Emericellopsis cladophorae]KAI6781575.1 hypothetical protein J7T54_005286 [Emericellopsis cladophorae]